MDDLNPLNSDETIDLWESNSENLRSWLEEIDSNELSRQVLGLFGGVWLVDDCILESW